MIELFFKNKITGQWKSAWFNRKEDVKYSYPLADMDSIYESSESKRARGAI